ncbi:hypothetical protein BN903_86 [Halorubrum sp. AJ67]|nr:hypothetical protein BN903_86 [Halorubrum sp. AJ67]
MYSVMARSTRRPGKKGSPRSRRRRGDGRRETHANDGDPPVPVFYKRRVKTRSSMLSVPSVAQIPTY